MDIETATRIILEKNPGIKSKELLPKVKKMTGKERSAICDKWTRLDRRGKIYREKGRYYLEKPTVQVKPSRLHLFEYLKWNKEFKLKKEQQEQNEDFARMQSARRSIADLFPENEIMQTFRVLADNDEKERKKTL